MTPKLRNIILFSANAALANSTASYLNKVFGLKVVPVAEISDVYSESYTVAVFVSTVVDLEPLQALGCVINIDSYSAKSVEELANLVFEEACDNFVGELSSDETLVA